MESQVYNELNKAWKSTCKVIFGEEIGDLKEYEGWITSFLPPVAKRKSYISGKDVALVTPSIDKYCKDAKIISADEWKEKKVELNVNEIKDIDGIVEAISEKWEYCGDIILGNSKFIKGSSLITNSNYIYDSYDVSDSNYVGYSTFLRKQSSYCFGGMGPNNEFLIRGICANVKRGLEAILSLNSSDIYFTHNCNNCSNLMFSFNLKNKKNCIGNLQLTPDKYKELKSKLIVEIREELKRNKVLPSIFDLSGNRKPDIKIDILKESEQKFDISPIEKSFTSTCKVIFQKELDGIQNYEKYLSKHIELIEELRSPFGSIVSQRSEPFIKYPRNKLVSETEAYELVKFPLNENETSSFEKIKDNINKISYFVGPLKEGNVYNYKGSYLMIDSANLYKTSDANTSEYCGVNNMALHSKYVFGCWRILDSQFSINCHNSIRLIRCFEVDSSSDCSDTYFTHNCEGLSDAMFCWNTKAKRYAIGNFQLPRDQYKKIKDMLVEQMADEILKKKELKWDIFNIGCGRRT